MKLKHFILFACCLAHLTSNGQGIISTVAGNLTPGYSGDGGLAIGALLNDPQSVCADNSGNIYFTELRNGIVRKINSTTGIITTVAGTGLPGYSDGGGVATMAQLKNPNGLCVDASGNLYVADGSNHRIRKIILATGLITTVAGTGTGDYTGDGGSATNATLYIPTGIALDNANNLYVSEYGNNVVRKISLSSGIITTIAGTGTSGYSGDGGPATNAKFFGPQGIFVDRNNDIYITDQLNYRVRKITALTGIISTIAGTGTYGSSGDGGLATGAQVSLLSDLFVDSFFNIYLAEPTNNKIRKIDGSTGLITAIAGTGTQGASGDGGPATAAEMWAPTGLCKSHSGDIYIAESGNNQIRKVTGNAVSGITTTSTYPQNIYPIPCTNELHIDNAMAGTTFLISDITGRKVYEGTLTKNNNILQVSELHTGTYILELSDYNINNRFIIARE